MPDRLAIFSDIHGNVTALRAALDDIQARGITRVVNLGDVTGKGPRGSEAIKLTRETCEASVRGNWDTFIASEASATASELAQWTRAELTAEDRAWLGSRPGTFELVMSGRRIRLFHASQTSELVRVRRRHTPEEFDGMFTNTEFTGPFRAGGEVGSASAELTPDVVGYGDIHAVYLEISGGRTLFNVGAVGNPLDAPTAPYVILEGVTDGDASAPFSVNFARVSYDIEAEIAAARALGLPEAELYARELREGIYRGRG
jgi:predicted phosphodiesterase